ncbi:2,3-diaminopropionate biosynthesis protein SbnA [Kitasatospora nipponensis]|uniref:N-(2-amino-2-carboxyethyl)-L-glutamate synthase n=1 Tax=Kitasatospora nipponensis TaxID=258049 RepID=A0ABP4H7C3_9ACTN
MARRALHGLPAVIGGTPLIELQHLVPEFRSRLLVKTERFNPGGSIKDRTALAMLLGAIESGDLDPERSVVIESSSGNLGVGLAQICRYFGLRFICVVDAKTTSRNLELLRAYQAEVEVVSRPDEESGEFLPARLRRVRELLAAIPHAYWPNQYANPNNPRAHQQTMREIAQALEDRVDYLFASVGTFGTLRGCAEYIRTHRLGTRIIGVDAVGSVIFDQPPAPRLLPGHGASIRPPLTDASLVDEVVHVSDLEAVVGCRRLLRREAVLAGGSSGAVTAALLGYRDRIPAGSTCVLIYPDGGDRYLDTIFNDAWVTEKFGEVAHLWKDALPPAAATPAAGAQPVG